MRTVDELMATAEPAWPSLEKELRGNPQVRILPISTAAGRETLYRLQVTTRSDLGALALHTGGVLVDDGWLRVLGGDGGHGMLSLAGANGLPGDERPPASLLVGYDVLGGRFELNGPQPQVIGRPGSAGSMCYFGPDSLKWECLDVGLGAWLAWLAGGGTVEFYDALRWPGWQEEARALPLTHGIAVCPFLWSVQAQQDLAGTARRAVPMTELFSAQDDFAAAFDAEPDTTTVQIQAK